MHPQISTQIAICCLLPLVVVLVSCTDRTPQQPENLDPVVTIALPADGETLFAGDEVEVRVVVADEEPGSVMILVESDIAGELANGVADDAGIFVVSSLLAGGGHTLTATAEDEDGASAMDEIWIDVVAPQPIEDADGDGVTTAAGDCDDSDPLISPRMFEICGDGADNDCDGAVDNADLDGDGYIDADPGCGGADCDDLSTSVNPGLDELCGDGVDNDCDGTAEVVDGDGDGVLSLACGGNDCDDSSWFVAPNAAEVCDTIDNNCDGQIDEGLTCRPGCSVLSDEPSRITYMFCDDAAAWNTARQYCVDMGAQFVVIEDMIENELLRAAGEIINIKFYIGADDQAAEGVWRWADGTQFWQGDETGSALTWATWAGGEPNNSLGSGGEHCAEMHTGSGDWNDIPCALARAYICEVP